MGDGTKDLALKVGDGTEDLAAGVGGALAPPPLRAGTFFGKSCDAQAKEQALTPPQAKEQAPTPPQAKEQAPTPPPRGATSMPRTDSHKENAFPSLD